MVPPVTWRPDILPGYSSTDIPLPSSALEPGESASSIGAVVIRRDGPSETLVGQTGPGGPGGRSGVLYLHGWNDYFFQAHLGDFWAEQGYGFYALDLRRYGRARRPGQYYGYITDLDDYAAEIDAAVAIMHADGYRHLVLMGHSTGGLVASLYADTHPEVFSALVLNSPWLELAGNVWLRSLTSAMVTGVGRMAPTAALPIADAGFYRRTLHADDGGEWSYDLAWKSGPDALIRLGWGRAILRGHERVARGLAIDCPILVMSSDHSYVGTTWSEEMRHADIVLDSDGIARRAPDLGPVVTVVRITNGMHDLVLSEPGVRAEVFRAMATWLAAYCPA